MMANSHRSISWLRRWALRLPAALVLAAVLPLGASPAAAEQGTFEVVCTPDTFQPGVWVAVECVTVIANGTQDVALGGRVAVGSISGPFPDYFWMWNTRDGEYVPVGTSDLSFEGDEPLEPGQSSESRLIGLLRMREGTWRGDDTLYSGDREVATIPAQLVASDGATAPPQNLLVTKTLVEGGTTEGTPTATYETKITNQGSTTFTTLIITDRTENGSLLDAEPAPSARNDAVNLVTWDLSSFGTDSLAPGESLLLRTTYGPPSGDYGCSYVRSGVVVEAEADGTVERYGTRPEEEAFVGDCSYDYEPGGRGGPVAAPPTGEGPGEGVFDFIWAATFLAAGGAALMGAATLVRRRLRR
ncbi:MAG TPA: hypothetical protein VM013_09430 [Dehalococcoidia bacterium]|nr:hypothetical protein [Dehalococcoidia bacterium]